MQGYGKSVVPYPFSILDRDESTVWSILRQDYREPLVRYFSWKQIKGSAYNNRKVSSSPQYLSVRVMIHPSFVCGIWSNVTGHIWFWMTSISVELRWKCFCAFLRARRAWVSPWKYSPVFRGEDKVSFAGRSDAGQSLWVSDRKLHHK